MTVYLLLTAGAVQAVDTSCCGALSAYLQAAESALLQLDVMLRCVDGNEGCSSWAAMGECTKNPGFMHDACRKSCGRCALSGSDAAAASEIALLAARNLDLACTLGARVSSGPAPKACSTVTQEVRALGAGGGMSEDDLRALLHAHWDQVGAACPSSSAACAFGQVPMSALPRDVQGAMSAPPQPAPSSEERAAAATIALAGRAADGGGGSSEVVQMPTIGLGTWLTVGDECTKMVTAALAAGFRHIDTSENYANHDAIGKALAASNVPRAELFLADKISLPTSYSSKGVRFAVAQALASLQTDYLDLLMLHSVGPSRAARNEAWAEMVKLQEEGVVRAIGTSNFGTHEMAELRVDSPAHPPVTHQIKFNPYHPGRTGNVNGEDFAADCRSNGCHLVAYCPLNSWPSKLAPIHDGHVAAIARRIGRSPAQVLLRWVLQSGHIPLTRSSSEAHLREAMQIFDFALSKSDMATISGLAWLVQSMQHTPPASIADAFGVMGAPAAAAARLEDEGGRVEL